MNKVAGIGSDPEFILKDYAGNFVSAIGKIKGNKEAPVACSGGAMQVDNVMVEYNTDPVTDADLFVEKHLQVQRSILDIVEPMGLQMGNEASFLMPSSELEHPDASIFGCAPDFNSWTMKVNSEVIPPMPNFRCAGGHIHVTWDEGTEFKYMLSSMKVMDLLLGVPSVLLDQDTERRKMYGKAGAHRYKKYSKSLRGMEYRVLSNFWVFKEKYIRWAFNQTQLAGNRTEAYITDVAKDEERIVTCINNSDIDLAIELCNEYDIIMP